MAWLSSCFSGSDQRAASSEPEPCAEMIIQPQTTKESLQVAAPSCQVSSSAPSTAVAMYTAPKTSGPTPSPEAPAIATKHNRLRKLTSTALAHAADASALVAVLLPEQSDITALVLTLNSSGTLTARRAPQLCGAGFHGQAAQSACGLQLATQPQHDEECCLELKYLNSAAAACAKACGSASYEQLLTTLLSGSPALGIVLDSAAQAALCGRWRRHEYRQPEHNTVPSALRNSTLTVEACLWQEQPGAAAIPALLLQHSALSPPPFPIVKAPVYSHMSVLSPSQSLAQTSGGHCSVEGDEKQRLLNNMSVLVTLMTAQGHALYQNKDSMDYYGNICVDRRASPEQAVTLEELLSRLFCMEGEEDLTSSCLEAVAEGKEWRRVVQVPQTLRRDSIHSHAETEMIRQLSQTRSNAMQSQRSFSEIMTALGSNMSRPGVRRMSSLMERPGRDPMHDAPIEIEHQSLSLTQRLSEDDPTSQSNQLMSLLTDADDIASGSELARQACPTVPRSGSGAADLGTLLESEEHTCLYHEVVVRPVPHPVTGDLHSLAAAERLGLKQLGWYASAFKVQEHVPRPSVARLQWLLLQTDATSRAEMEATFAELMDFQLTMLSNIFPRHIVEFLSVNDVHDVPESFGQIACAHEEVTILFADVVGFTSMCDQVPARSVMAFLNELFTRFDSLAEAHCVHKVETAGDCYIVSAGVLRHDKASGFHVLQTQHDPAESAARVLAFAKDMLRASHLVRMPHNGETVTIRIGLHTGPCVSGLVGTTVPKYSVFGDTMNTASRMESTCIPGQIQVSSSTWRLLSGAEKEGWVATGGLEVKGKGVMETFLWHPTDVSLEMAVASCGGSSCQHSGLMSRHLSSLLLRSPLRNLGGRRLPPRTGGL